MRYSGYTDLLLGYNSNGFAHHRLSDCVSILRELGYQSIALTLCHHQLDPPDRRGVSGAIHRIEREVSAAGLDVTIETGARFILDPRRKHHPALVSRSAAGRAKRIGFLKAGVDVAAAVGADSVAIWSGAADDNARATA
ncbi:MAG: sugar phosphate isomerase/epimerase, partial [Phycisphaerae bacterium]